MYYLCPKCGVLGTDPVTDVDLDQVCPSCGRPVRLQDFDRPFLESTDKQSNVVLMVIIVMILLGACALIARLSG